VRQASVPSLIHNNSSIVEAMAEACAEGYQERRGEYYAQQPPQQKSHAGRNIALAGVAELAAGALLMHEGERVGVYHALCHLYLAMGVHDD
jgi:hypothetical protein